MSVGVGFDSSVLSPFARAMRLDVLERLVQGRRCVVTRAVLEEIERGCAEHPALAMVGTLSWLEVVSIDALAALRVFNAYMRVLGEDERNVGEASILAWAEVTGSIAVVDDNAAVIAARARRVQVRRTLALLCDGLNRRLMTIEHACELVDELISRGGARLPCKGADFPGWAEGKGLIVPG
jgi:hypothetical protein